MAAGFTVATYPSGDKLNTLIQMSVFAAQSGMIWVNNSGLGEKLSGKDIGNSCGSWLGYMATSICDKDKLIDDSDKIGALKFGKRFAQAVKRWG
jgi:NAD(P)H dehydrogenase (quinone)